MSNKTPIDTIIEQAEIARRRLEKFDEVLYEGSPAEDFGFDCECVDKALSNIVLIALGVRDRGEYKRSEVSHKIANVPDDICHSCPQLRESECVAFSFPHSVIERVSGQVDEGEMKCRSPKKQ